MAHHQKGSIQFWSLEEDAKIEELVEEMGGVLFVPMKWWHMVATSLGTGRRATDCRQRWESELRKRHRKLGTWSTAENVVIACLHARVQGGWSRMADYLLFRTQLDIKNHVKTPEKSDRLPRVPATNLLEAYIKRLRETGKSDHLGALLSAFSSFSHELDKVELERDAWLAQVEALVQLGPQQMQLETLQMLDLGDGPEDILAAMTRLARMQQQLQAQAAAAQHGNPHQRAGPGVAAEALAAAAAAAAYSLAGPDPSARGPAAPHLPLLQSYSLDAGMTPFTPRQQPPPQPWPSASAGPFSLAQGSPSSAAGMPAVAPPLQLEQLGAVRMVPVLPLMQGQASSPLPLGSSLGGGGGSPGGGCAGFSGHLPLTNSLSSDLLLGLPCDQRLAAGLGGFLPAKGRGHAANLDCCPPPPPLPQQQQQQQLGGLQGVAIKVERAESSPAGMEAPLPMPVRRRQKRCSTSGASGMHRPRHLSESGAAFAATASRAAMAFSPDHHPAHHGGGSGSFPGPLSPITTGMKRSLELQGAYDGTPSLGSGGSKRCQGAGSPQSPHAQHAMVMAPGEEPSWAAFAARQDPPSRICSVSCPGKLQPQLPGSPTDWGRHQSMASVASAAGCMDAAFLSLMQQQQQQGYSQHVPASPASVSQHGHPGLPPLSSGQQQQQQHAMQQQQKAMQPPPCHRTFGSPDLVRPPYTQRQQQPQLHQATPSSGSLDRSPTVAAWQYAGQYNASPGAGQSGCMPHEAANHQALKPQQQCTGSYQQLHASPQVSAGLHPPPTPTVAELGFFHHSMQPMGLEQATVFLKQEEGLLQEGHDLDYANALAMLDDEGAAGMGFEAFL